MLIGEYFEEVTSKQWALIGEDNTILICDALHVQDAPKFAYIIGLLMDPCYSGTLSLLMLVDLMLLPSSEPQ